MITSLPRASWFTVSMNLMPMSAADDTLGGHEPTMVILIGSAARLSPPEPSIMAPANSPDAVILKLRLRFLILFLLPGIGPIRRGGLRDRLWGTCLAAPCESKEIVHTRVAEDHALPFLTDPVPRPPEVGAIATPEPFVTGQA